ncbi:MAG: hypothetical protein JXL97_15690 [Bacteroidales bacterium]|nr:hypothetical protein [Bacteroidales bacterium]
MIAIFLLAYLLMFVIIESLQKLVFKKTQWSRKAAHIGMGIIVFLMPLYLSKIEIIIIAIGFTVVLTISKYKQILSLHKVERKTIGEVLYPASIGIIAAISLPQNVEAFQAGALSLAFADGFAAVVGTSFPIKQFKVFKNKKSIGGSLTFAIIASLIIISFPSMQDVNPLLKIMFVILLTLSEFFLIFGLDNLFIPLFAALFFLITT